jgi:hypothetical protein
MSRLFQSLSMAVLSAAFMCIPARADDNLVCLPPAVDLQHGSVIIFNPGKWTKVGANQSVSICVPIDKSAAVASLQCARSQIDIMEGEPAPHTFRCNIGTQCFGGGTYQSVARQPAAPGGDQICAVFASTLDRPQDVGFSFTQAKKEPSPPKGADKPASPENKTMGANKPRSPDNKATKEK